MSVKLFAEISWMEYFQRVHYRLIRPDLQDSGKFALIWSELQLSILMDHELRRANAVFSETVNIVVESEWNDEAKNSVQMCPALLLASQKAIPNAVKYIYSRLAAYASHIDEGMPDIILSLISTGNSFDLQVKKKSIWFSAAFKSFKSGLNCFHSIIFRDHLLIV